MAYYISINEYDQAEVVLREWLSILAVIRRYDETGIVEVEYQKLGSIVGLTDPELILLREAYVKSIDQSQWDKGLQIKQLIRMREESLKGEERNLVKCFTIELQKADQLRQTILGMIRSRPDRCLIVNALGEQVDKQFLNLTQQVPQTSYGQLAELLVVLQQQYQVFLARLDNQPIVAVSATQQAFPEHIKIENVPHYGFLDFGKALSLVTKKQMSSQIEGGLKILDILTGR